MNTTQAREISIEKILQNLGFEAVKKNQFESWYLSPFRLEKTPSFKLNLKLNRWYDHGEQIGGNVIDLIVKLKKCTVSEALNYLQNFDTFSFQKQTTVSYERKKQENCNSIFKINKIEHIALKQYLTGRGITNLYALDQIKEIHYQVNQRKYFAIGFKNNTDGYELRSCYTKSCIKKKDITLIYNQSVVLRIFEGFLDYLSFLQLNGSKSEKDSDYLVLNSAALVVKNIELLDHYKTIELYLDNDATGEKYTNLIIERYPQARDERFKYSKYKDLNEYLCKCKLI